VRFCIVIEYFSQGGAERVISRLSTKLCDIGHEVTILAFSKNVEYEIDDRINLEILSIRSEPKLFKRKKISKVLQHYIDNSHSYDAIISNLPSTDKIVSKIKHINIYYCIHNSFHTGYIKKKTKILGFLKKLRIRSLYRNKNLIFVSQGAKEEMIDIIGARPKRHAVIHNPFPVNKIRQLSLVDHDAINFSYFLHVGRFNDQKRHDRLFSIFKRANVDSKLVLLGDGTEEQTKRVYGLINNYGLDEKVELLGFRENPYPFIKNAKALLLTSDYEGLPTVIIESLICGTPVLSVNCPSGPEEIMGSQFPEYLFSASDEDGFASMICELDKSSRRIEFKNANRFDEELIARKYLDFCTVDVGD
jgi:glycosyltransferase involved in cell wall biosynthesis